MINGRLITGCLILLLAITPVNAAPFHHHQRMQVAQNGPAGHSGISLDQAVSQARQQYQGKVLSAETTTVNGRKVYRIKILTSDGRVKRTQIDARSGQQQSRGR
jgi:uncharacterized membrane protein YkoI